MAVFRLLGTFGLFDAKQPVPLGYPQQRAVLAALLVAHGRPVGMTTLIDRVWGDAAPPTARELIYGHTARLRRALRGYAEITRTAAGYACDVGSHHVDRYQFDDLVAAARAATDPAVRAIALIEALDLWDSEPLGGVPGDWAARTRRAWQRQRINVHSELNQTELDRGRHAELVFPLSALVSENPDNETLVGQLAVALHRSGQSGDARDLLRRTRVMLAEQQGLDPGPELRALERGILTEAGPPSTRPSPLPARHSLPLDVAGFVGRTGALRAMSAAAVAVKPGLAGVVVLSGGAGVGKTATALHWANRMGREFPGGSYYFDHVPGRFELPSAADDRRLVLLDNVERPDDVVPALSTLPGALTVVLSRRSMPELVVTSAATSIHLDSLSHAEALEVLTHRLAHRADEAAVFGRIVRACGHLPLALVQVAGRAAAEPGIPLSQLADQLDRPDERLDVLEFHRIPGLRAAFAASERGLSPAARRAFVLLSAAPGGRFDPDWAAPVLGADLPAARALIAELHRSNLIEQTQRDQFGFPELVWLYAKERIGGVDLDGSSAEPDASTRSRRNTGLGKLMRH